MQYFSKYYKTRCCSFWWHLVLFVFLGYENITDLKAQVHCGVTALLIASDGIVDSLKSCVGIEPTLICEGNCYTFSNQYETRNLIADTIIRYYFVEDSIIWKFPGYPLMIGGKYYSPRVCFDEIMGIDTVLFYVRTTWYYYNTQNIFTQFWQEKGFYLKTKKCPPIALFGQDETTICSGQSVFFADSSYSSPDSWLWHFDGGQPASWSGNDPPPIQYNSPGEYPVSLSVYNSLGGDTLTKKSLVKVSNRPKPNTDYSDHYTGLIGADTLLRPCSFGDTYRWSPAEGLSCDDCKQPVLTFGHSNEYSLTTTTNDGLCRDSCTVFITAETEAPQVFFPNVISPNGDGKNDNFEGSWLHIEPMELRIFDRWGGLKYVSNTHFAWDGTYNGQVVAPGVFVFYFRYKNSFTGIEEVKSGSVTVVR